MEVPYSLENSTQVGLLLSRHLHVGFLFSDLTIITLETATLLGGAGQCCKIKMASDSQSLETKGFYNKHELRRLSSCLGYPSTLFVDVFHSTSRSKASLRAEYLKLLIGKPIAETHIKQLLDSKQLHYRVDKVFNRFSSKYNIKVIKKAMYLLRHDRMTFAELSSARVAFEVYSCKDETGLVTDVDTVLRALRITKRVMSPLKLESEVQKQQHRVDIPSRIQLYEFFDMVLLSSKVTTVESEMKSSEACMLDESERNTELSLPNFDQLLMTADQKMLAYLDAKHRSSMYREVHPTPDVLDTEHIVPAAPRRDLKLLSREQYNAFSPPLEQSQLKLHQARRGGLVFSTEQHMAVESASHSRLSSPYPQLMPSLTKTSCQLQDRTSISQKTASRVRSSSPQMPNVIAKSFRRVPKKVGDIQTPRLSHLKQETRFNTPDLPASEMELTENNSAKKSDNPSRSSCFMKQDCVMSVLKAREALASSMSNLPQHEGHADDVLEHKMLCDRSNSFIEAPSPRARTDSELTMDRTPHYKPIVSFEERKEHQGCMDDLRWASLRLTSDSNIGRTKVSGK